MTPVYLPAQAQDFEALLALRIRAMRPSLARIGRFDPERARARFRDSFHPAATCKIMLGDVCAGFYALRALPDSLELDHLYIEPDQQGCGLGAAVLAHVFAHADAIGLPVHVGALRDSDSNRFYRRHGFVQSGESEWDIHYARPPAVVQANSTSG
ncbi:Acetyltransferase (GNAT) domain-containing protein [Andreprevotia lacus DSM 23236]|jgi:GNAT superfamily N-acetyltransferase|uniref:Acetyltransferase (GNAT) domain-containing protein n=1 Tax=Andreprevotia lacus DSM 23236 TaxID=1121001 RepID=A0A1W1XP01_9NEIS|nr:GNAT family N-acetyltransferase [Andreprevotia lacus]SMC25241.1 Acetyltransferase (GNAT) domain-containing protein [Andreprevotia lacus DSM 23236]